MKEEHETRGAADVYKWWLFLTTDVIGELSFGASFRMLENGKINQYAVDLQSAGRIASYRSAFPTLFKYCVRFGLSLPLLEQARGLGIRMRKYAQESLQRHRDVVAEHGVDAKPTLFTKVWVAEETDTITSDEIQNNAQAYIIAGSDTTSNELTYLVWAVCRRPDVKSRLLGELATLPDDFQYEQLRQLPYLNHVIDETLRRYPTAPAGLPREVPLGGAQVCGHYIPAGYTVATQAYTMHRNQAVFPEPEKFDPSRWENPTQAMKDSFMPFGAGSRICIGLHLAKMELRIGAARFFKAFPGAKISAVEGMSDEDMRPELFFLANPTGHRCLVELQ
ncbi:cytochrome P450 [Poronia punctata]|nr:cytochrome P450 [Poronia punctata]